MPKLIRTLKRIVPPKPKQPSESPKEEETATAAVAPSQKNYMPALIHHSQLLGEEDGTAATTTSLDKKSSSAQTVNSTSTRERMRMTSPAETSDDTKSSMNSDNIATYSDRKRKTSSVAVDDDLATERARSYKKSKLCSAEGCTNIIRVCVKHGAKKKQVAGKVAPIKLRSEKCGLGTGQKNVDMNAPLRSAQILLISHIPLENNM